jgi:hypothetical protein
MNARPRGAGIRVVPKLAETLSPSSGAALLLVVDRAQVPQRQRHHDTPGLCASQSTTGWASLSGSGVETPPRCLSSTGGESSGGSACLRAAGNSRKSCGLDR